MHEQPHDTPNVIAFPPLLFALPLALGIVTERLFPLHLLPRRLSRAVGWPLVGTGLLIGLSAVATMRRAKTNISPHAPATTLVIAGPFRWTRNPIYVSFVLLYAGIALLTNAFWALLGLPGVVRVVQRGVIEREEAYLEARFGEAYRAYKQQARRWL